MKGLITRELGRVESGEYDCAYDEDEYAGLASFVKHNPPDADDLISSARGACACVHVRMCACAHVHVCNCMYATACMQLHVCITVRAGHTATGLHVHMPTHAHTCRKGSRS